MTNVSVPMKDSVPMHPVASSNLAYEGYDEGAQVLYIKFKSGAVWRYKAFPPDQYKAFKLAPSAGSFFYHNIRGAYVEERVA